MATHLRIIGGGLAGCEAAWQAAERGVAVTLHEMRPANTTEAHQTDKLAELVCSNSLRSDDSDSNAVGLLHDELRRCGSLIMRMADAHKLPAGGALAVDREAFAAAITEAIAAHPLITVRREEITELPTVASFEAEHVFNHPPLAGGSKSRCDFGEGSQKETPSPAKTKALLTQDQVFASSPARGEELNGSDRIIVATGPLTSPALAEGIQKLTGMEHLHFFDAIAPIVHAESIDMAKAWRQSRYDKAGPGGTGADYINCAMDKAQYEAFIHELLTAPKTEFKAWEKSTPYFEGCLPIEVMASRGAETLRFGPMKPVGLTNPHTGARPYAVVQLRQDNALGTLYNLVGFQTKLKYAEQERVFRMIPGLERAGFARLGGLHRNTFINSPLLLDAQLRLKTRPGIRFAGQITGVEGYVESTAMGLLAGVFAAAEATGRTLAPPPQESALGALLAHITGAAEAETFQPMNVNFGLFPPVPAARGGKERKLAMTARAKEALTPWAGSIHAANLNAARATALMNT